MDDEQDAFGRLVLDHLEGRPRTQEIVEREDGFISAGLGPAIYFEPFRRWPPHERRAMRFVRGRVLDVGCGGGRVCLHLQTRGLDVVGIDASPGAIECCRQRGIRDARLLSVDAVDASLGSFDTIVLLGQNFGLLASRARARRLLKRFARVATSAGRIVAETFDPHALDDGVHRRYRERNQLRGRMPGQLRVRVRYRELSTPWLDWLQVSPHELGDLLRGTGWQLSRTLGDGPSYVAIVDRT